MAARRRRRRKYTWFPTQRSTLRPEGSITQINGFRSSVGVDGTAPALQIHPLIPTDVPQESWGAGSDTDKSLADVIGGDYVVERIVGKFFAWTQNNQETEGIISGAYVKFGIFVARADESQPSAPLGAEQANLLDIIRSFSPMSNETTREPWMFVRSWYLGSQGLNLSSGGIVIPQNGESRFPPTTAGYGSVQDGPHVDVKSVRRIRQDERLWAAVAIERLPLGLEVTSTDEVIVKYHFDYRVLGALRRAHNRSTF